MPLKPLSLKLCLALALLPAALCAAGPMFDGFPRPPLPGMPTESSGLKALRHDMALQAEKLDALRIKELQLMAEDAGKAAAAAEAKGDSEQAASFHEQALGFKEDAVQQAKQAELRSKMRQAWESGDASKVQPLMEEMRRLEEGSHKRRLARGLGMHETMLKQLRSRLQEDLKEAGLSKARLKAGQQALALVEGMLQATAAIRRAEAKDDKEALARLLSESESKKDELRALITKLKGGKQPGPRPGPGSEPGSEMEGMPEEGAPGPGGMLPPPGQGGPWGAPDGPGPGGMPGH